MLAINPDECIDCGVCEPECPAEAIVSGNDESGEKWLELNKNYAQVWPQITQAKLPPKGANDFVKVEDKFNKYFSEQPGKGDEE